jgi:hypothetical protein
MKRHTGFVQNMSICIAALFVLWSSQLNFLGNYTPLNPLETVLKYIIFYYWLVASHLEIWNDFLGNQQLLTISQTLEDMGRFLHRRKQAIIRSKLLKRKLIGEFTLVIHVTTYLHRPSLPDQSILTSSKDYLWPLSLYKYKFIVTSRVRIACAWLVTLDFGEERRGESMALFTTWTEERRVFRLRRGEESSRRPHGS